MLPFLVLVSLVTRVAGATLYLNCLGTQSVYSFHDGECVDISAYVASATGATVSMVRPTCEFNAETGVPTGFSIQDCVTDLYNYKSPLRVPHPAYLSTRVVGDPLSCTKAAKYTAWKMVDNREVYSNQTTYMSVNCKGASPTALVIPSGLYPFIPSPVPSQAPSSNVSATVSLTTTVPTESNSGSDSESVNVAISLGVVVVVMVVLLCVIHKLLKNNNAANGVSASEMEILA